MIGEALGVYSTIVDKEWGARKQDLFSAAAIGSCNNHIAANNHTAAIDYHIAGDYWFNDIAAVVLRVEPTITRNTALVTTRLTNPRKLTMVDNR